MAVATARVSKPKLVRAVCGNCNRRFSYRSATGGPRTYCDDCAPRKSRRPGSEPKRRSTRAVAGQPFTIAHFRSWTRRLRLPGDKRFALEQWQEDFAEDLFEGMRAGWLRAAWLVVPEGNGKSTFVAVLVLYAIEFAPDASIPVAASARDQAEIIFQQGSGFVRRTPQLAGRFKAKPGLRELVFNGTSRAKIMASDAGSGDGVIPFPFEVIDELHRHKDLELYRTWAGKLDKEQAVLVVISTAGEPGSEFEELREEMRRSAVDVQRGECFGRFVGATSLLHEYAVPEDGDVDDLALVKAANPSRRITVKTLAAKRARPEFSSPHWRRLTCNMPTRADSAAISEREYAAALAPDDSEFFVDGRREIPEGESVWAGLDLGFVHDPTALVPFWMPEPSFRLLGPAVILEPPTDGSQLDVHLVERALIELHTRTPLDVVAMDMTKGEQLAQWIQEELGAEVVNVSQGNKTAALEYERFMEGLRTHVLFHTGDEGLRRHALNAVAQLLPGGDTRFNRPRPSRTVAPELQRRRVWDALKAASMVHAVAVGELVEGGGGVVYA